MDLAEDPGALEKRRPGLEIDEQAFPAQEGRAALGDRQAFDRGGERERVEAQPADGDVPAE